MTNLQNGEEENLPSPEIISSENETEADQEFTNEQENREDSRFKEGQILSFVRVRFPGNSRSFAFLIGKRRIDYGQKVVAMSDRGMAVGYVNSFPYEVAFNKSMLPVRSISKLATEDDIFKDREAYLKQKNAENICNDLIEEHQLDMHLTHVEFTSYGKKAVFYFIAPSRVDFRDLVRALVAQLKTRIELRQISVRDRSAAVGGIGPCGLELCCSSFLTKYGNVGIKMAKNQDLTLNFSKLNGVCGQLKCCLQYEDDVYRDKRSHLPREGDFISTHTGEIGRVDRLHLLNEQFVMMTNRGVRKRYTVNLYKETLDRDTANFPKEFDSVSDETHTVIGLEEAQAEKKRQQDKEIKGHQETSKKFADAVFENLFGEKTLDYSLPEVLEPESSRSRPVKNLDEEEELTYIPSEDELLPDDDDSFASMAATGPVREHRHSPSADRNQGRDQSGASRSQEPERRPEGGGGGGGRNRNRRPSGGNRGPRNPR